MSSDDQRPRSGSDLDIFEGLGKKPEQAEPQNLAGRARADMKRTLIGIPDPAVLRGKAPAHPSFVPSSSPPTQPQPLPPPPGRGALPSLDAEQPPTRKAGASELPPLSAAPIAAATEPSLGPSSATFEVPAAAAAVDAHPLPELRNLATALATEDATSGVAREPVPTGPPPRNPRLDEVDWDKDDDATHVFGKDAREAAKKAALEAAKRAALPRDDATVARPARVEDLAKASGPASASGVDEDAARTLEHPAAIPPPRESARDIVGSGEVESIPDESDEHASLASLTAAIGPKPGGSAPPPSVRLRSVPPPSAHTKSAPPAPLPDAPPPPAPPQKRDSSSLLAAFGSLGQARDKRGNSAPPPPVRGPTELRTPPPPPPVPPPAAAREKPSAPPPARTTKEGASRPPPKRSSHPPPLPPIEEPTLAREPAASEAPPALSAPPPASAPNKRSAPTQQIPRDEPSSSLPQIAMLSGLVIVLVAGVMYWMRPAARPAPPPTVTATPSSEPSGPRATASGGTGIRAAAAGGTVRLAIDGREVGLLPVEVKDLEPGDHKLRFSGDRFATLEKTISVAPNEIVDIGPVALKVTRGKATLTLATPGAKVHLVSAGSRKEIPQFPIALEFDTNEKWELSATKDGHEELRERIAFEDGHPEKTIAIKLEPKSAPSAKPVAPAKPPRETPPKEPKDPKPEEPSTREATETALKINSLPASSVFLDGKPIGVTPQPRVVVSPGQHTVQFVNAEQGLKKTITVDVKSGETKAVSAKLRD